MAPTTDGTAALGTVMLCAAAAAGIRFLSDMHEVRNPQPYLDLATNERHQEKRPWSDVVKHVTIFRWIRPLLG